MIEQQEALDLIKQLHKRCRQRERRHRGWRQTYIDCGGMCVWKDEDKLVCGETENLEFHEPFGECKAWNKDAPKFQTRVLMCRLHHTVEHGGSFPSTRGMMSNVATDIEAEIALCGGEDKWREKYKLKDTFGVLIYGDMSSPQLSMPGLL